MKFLLKNELITKDCTLLSISRIQNRDFILGTLKQAIKPAEDLSNLLIHSDQGILYQSPKYRNYLKKSSFTQSMSDKENAYDNAVVGSFFGSLKM